MKSSTHHSAIAVTHLASGDLWAGAESQLYNMVVALGQAGRVDIDVVLLNEGLLADRLRQAGVPVTVFPEVRFGAPRLLSLIRQHLIARRTQVLHTHRYKENVLGAAAAILAGGTRSMRTLHGAPEISTHIWMLRKSFPLLLDWLAARFVQFPVVCVSRELRDRCARSLPPRRLRVVGNGVDFDSLRQAAKHNVLQLTREGVFRVGFFGRLTAVKRVDIILEIAALLEQKAAGEFRIYVVGEGPLLSSLQQRSRQLGLQSAVQFVGFTDNPAAWLACMHALLLTSDHEGLPMIVLEAMGLGVPVVTHAVGAIPEVLGNGRFGTLIPNQEPAEYVDALLQMRNSPESVRARSIHAAKHVVDCYSAQRTGAEYLAIYEDICTNSSV